MSGTNGFILGFIAGSFVVGLVIVLASWRFEWKRKKNEEQP